MPSSRVVLPMTSSRVVLPLLVAAFLSIAPVVRGEHRPVCYECLCKVKELGFYVALSDGYDCDPPPPGSTPVPSPIVHLDASIESMVSGSGDAINGQSGQTWPMVGGCTRTQHDGVDVFDMTVPQCGFRTGEAKAFCGSDFGWTTADWVDWRDDIFSGYEYRSLHSMNTGHTLVMSKLTELGSYIPAGVGQGFNPIPNYSFLPEGWTLVVAVGQGTACGTTAGTTSFYVGTPTTHPNLVGTIGYSVGGVQNGNTYGYGYWGPGYAAESRVWNQALTYEEIETLWVETSPKFQ